MQIFELVRLHLMQPEHDANYPSLLIVQPNLMEVSLWTGAVEWCKQTTIEERTRAELDQDQAKN